MPDTQANGTQDFNMQDMEMWNMAHRILICRTWRCNGTQDYNIQDIEMWNMGCKSKKEQFGEIISDLLIKQRNKQLVFFPFVKNYGEINTAFMSLSYNFVQQHVHISEVCPPRKCFFLVINKGFSPILLMSQGRVLRISSDRDDWMKEKIKTQKNPQGFQQNPKKYLKQKLTPKKSHVEFLSHKNFQKALNDITWKIETLVLNTAKNPHLNQSTQKGS